MAYPAPKRIAFASCGLIWLGIQTLFFISPANSSQNFNLNSKQGNFEGVQIKREVVLRGAFSDRYERFPRLELVPFLKKKGVRHIRKLILTGHDSTETGALPELQKNFSVGEIEYPFDTAERMRKTFQKIDRNVGLKRLKPED